MKKMVAQPETLTVERVAEGLEELYDFTDKIPSANDLKARRAVGISYRGLTVAVQANSELVSPNPVDRALMVLRGLYARALFVLTAS